MKWALRAGPLGLAIIALLHSGFGDGVAAEAGLGLTNVSGRAGDCTAPTRLAACAPLFDGTESLLPGGPPIARSVTVTWQGARPSVFGLYVDRFLSRDPRSQPICTAADPAGKLILRVDQDGTPLYQGTLSDFQRDHGSASDALHLLGDSGRFTISIALDRSADNAYMGCVASADLVWIASQ